MSARRPKPCLCSEVMLKRIRGRHSHNAAPEYGHQQGVGDPQDCGGQQEGPRGVHVRIPLPVEAWQLEHAHVHLAGTVKHHLCVALTSTNTQTDFTVDKYNHLRVMSRRTMIMLKKTTLK